MARDTRGERRYPRWAPRHTLGLPARPPRAGPGP